MLIFCRLLGALAQTWFEAEIPCHTTPLSHFHGAFPASNCVTLSGALECASCATSNCKRRQTIKGLLLPLVRVTPGWALFSKRLIFIGHSRGPLSILSPASLGDAGCLSWASASAIRPGLFRLLARDVPLKASVWGEPGN